MRMRCPVQALFCAWAKCAQSDQMCWKVKMVGECNVVEESRRSLFPNHFAGAGASASPTPFGRLPRSKASRLVSANAVSSLSVVKSPSPEKDRNTTLSTRPIVKVMCREICIVEGGYLRAASKTSGMPSQSFMPAQLFAFAGT